MFKHNLFSCAEKLKYSSNIPDYFFLPFFLMLIKLYFPKCIIHLNGSTEVFLPL